MSFIERTTNRAIKVVFLFFIAIVLTAAIISAILLAQYPERGEAWYLGGSKEANNFLLPIALANICTFTVLFSQVVPISLYVIVEMVNLGQAYFLSMDVKMYHEESKTGAVTRDSKLCQELGVVDHVFSDKTGTLTENVMEFKECAVLGKQGLFEVVSECVDTDTRLFPLMRLLACTNTVLPTDDEDYQAESPDEAALVSAAASNGFALISRTNNSLTVTEDLTGEDRVFHLKGVHEFTSTRKRMSVVFSCSPPLPGFKEDQVFVYSKGADNIMFDRSAEVGQALHEHLSMFASKGLRTLVCAQRVLSPSEYAAWQTLYDEARASVQSREELLEACAATVEVDLNVVGVTAIEDKLQEGVPETIAGLMEAGIEVWVLTGDKIETAVNIAYSCKLLRKDMFVVYLIQDTKEKVDEQLRELKKVLSVATAESVTILQSVQSMLSTPFKSEKRRKEQKKETLPETPQVSHSPDVENDLVPLLGTGNNDIALIVDGATLELVMADKHLRIAFLEISEQCRSVVACRVSPAQKAEIVKLVKRNVVPTPVTLSIGDGANDVTMIQEAHIGVGLSGKEGKQAVNASDFSIAQFRFLSRLLFFHGRWNHRRMVKVILYNFYKNIAIVLILFLFNCFSLMTGTTLFDSWVRFGWYLLLGLV